MTRLPLTPAVLALLLGAAPAAAQYSDSYNLLKAVRERDGNQVTELLNRSGPSIINTREANSGDTPLHITVRERNLPFLRFLLARGANSALTNNEGATPLTLAAQLGAVETVQALVGGGADVNLGNRRGETPLIIAIQIRDVPMVRALLAAGADAKQADRVTGRSARDYAAQDSRTPILLQLIDEAKPVAPKRAVSGPKL